MKITLFAIAITTALSCSAEEQIYKCPDKDGRNVIRSQPCDKPYTLAPPIKKTPDWEGFIQCSMGTTLVGVTNKEDGKKKSEECTKRFKQSMPK